MLGFGSSDQRLGNESGSAGGLCPFVDVRGFETDRQRDISAGCCERGSVVSKNDGLARLDRHVRYKWTKKILMYTVTLNIWLVELHYISPLVS